MENIFPITKNKLVKERWLNQKIKYETDCTYLTIIDENVKVLYNWIDKTSDISLTTDKDSFRNDFINYLYNQYKAQ